VRLRGEHASKVTDIVELREYIRHRLDRLHFGEAAEQLGHCLVMRSPKASDVDNLLPVSVVTSTVATPNNIPRVVAASVPRPPGAQNQQDRPVLPAPLCDLRFASLPNARCCSVAQYPPPVPLAGVVSIQGDTTPMEGVTPMAQPWTDCVTPMAQIGSPLDAIAPPWAALLAQELVAVQQGQKEVQEGLQEMREVQAELERGQQQLHHLQLQILQRIDNFTSDIPIAVHTDN